jgi:DNA ligase-1
MTSKVKPMKADAADDSFLEKLRLPMFGSIKYDGIRTLIKEGVALSTSLSPLRNKFTQKFIKSEPRLEGMDGEFTIKWDGVPPFGKVSSAITSAEGEPEFTLNVFERWDMPDTPCYKRMTHLLDSPVFLDYDNVVLVEQRLLTTIDELLDYEADILALGYEGIMLKTYDGIYKYGDSTLREQYLVKRKPFVDEEAVVIGFVAQMENTNEATIDKLGHTKRGSSKAGMVPKDTLGKFKVKSKKWGEFVVGCGQMTHKTTKEIWDNQDSYLGKIITFKYQTCGTKDLPRLPIFKGFRDPSDISGASRDNVWLP